MKLTWKHYSNNPIIGGEGSFDAMSPYVVATADGMWHFFYTSTQQGPDDRRRICYAKCEAKYIKAGEIEKIENVGPILHPGGLFEFDEKALFYPRVHYFPETKKWHLYYTGQSANRKDSSYKFGDFWGIGLATNEDIREHTKWEKYVKGSKDKMPFENKPVIEGKFDHFGKVWMPVVSLGNIMNTDGIYRMYYTILPGTYLKDRLDIYNQRKMCAVIQSKDGKTWQDNQILFDRNLNSDHENVGVVGLNAVQMSGNIQLGFYTALSKVQNPKGTKVSVSGYKLLYAISHDNGNNWIRTDCPPLEPRGNGYFDSKDIGYPSFIEEGNKIWMFYNGAPLGITGIGFATLDVPKEFQ